MGFYSRLSHLLFDLEVAGENVFRSKVLPSSSIWQGTKRAIFGGQVAAQCLTAAYRTVPEDRLCHSFHSYFISPGDHTVPVHYHVKQIRDGRSYTSRMVEGVQKDTIIFSMIASFSKPEDDVVHINHPMPSVPAPEKLSVIDFLKSAVSNESVPANLRAAAQSRIDQYANIAMEVQPTDPLVYFRVKQADQPIVHSWVRPRDVAKETPPMTQRQGHALIAYMADLGILVGGGVSNVKLRTAFVTSLDHSVYFHEPSLSPLDFLLFESHCLYGGRGRTSNKGSLWRRDGKLAATVFQEGLVRLEKPGGTSGKHALKN